MFRRLTVPFEEAQAFRRELEWHIAQGGIFIPTQELFQLREVVEVQLDLRFCHAAPVFEAEVVNQVRPGRGSSAPLAGVALQFLDPAPKLRAELEAITGLRPPAPVVPPRPGPPRHHERRPARLAVRVDTGERRYDTHTLNVSRNGLLLPISGDLLSLGARVRLRLSHPHKAESLRAVARVMRHELSGGRPCAMGLQLESDTGSAAAQARFLEDCSSASHALDLGGIRGDLAAMGVPGLLQMLPASASTGTLDLIHARGELGRVLFEGGMLRHVSLSGIDGLKALCRMVAWDAGRFEFSPSIRPGEPEGASTGIENALLLALQHHDELTALDLSGLSAGAILERASGEPPGAEPKVEGQVMELLARPRRCGEIVDAIPAFDVEVYRALLGLLDAGAIRQRG